MGKRLAALREAIDTVKHARDRSSIFLALVVVVAALAALVQLLAKDSAADPFAHVQRRSVLVKKGSIRQSPAPRTHPPIGPPKADPAPAPNPNSVQVGTPHAEPGRPVSAANSSRVVVQLRAFWDRAEAGRFAAKVAKAGFPCSVTQGATASGRTVYRVRLESVSHKKEAWRIVARLKHEFPQLRPIALPAQP